MIKINWTKLRIDVRDQSSAKLPIELIFKTPDGDIMIPIAKRNAKYMRKQLKKALKYLD